MTVEQFQDARALVRVVDLGIARIEIVRDQTLLEHPVERVLISGLHVIGQIPARAAIPSAKRRASAIDALRFGGFRG